MSLKKILAGYGAYKLSGGCFGLLVIIAIIVILFVL
ncbi:hypothetical protein BH23BAC3_BH23BAC3_05260 [soil metagenome]